VTKGNTTTTALLLPITVRLTTAEAAALSFVAVMVTSAVDVAVVNAADRGLLKLREAAAGHVR
jgi:hypothetical protein